MPRNAPFVGASTPLAGTERMSSASARNSLPTSASHRFLQAFQEICNAARSALSFLTSFNIYPAPRSDLKGMMGTEGVWIPTRHDSSTTEGKQLADPALNSEPMLSRLQDRPVSDTEFSPVTQQQKDSTPHVDTLQAVGKSEPKQANKRAQSRQEAALDAVVDDATNLITLCIAVAVKAPGGDILLSQLHEIVRHCSTFEAAPATDATDEDDLNWRVDRRNSSGLRGEYPPSSIAKDSVFATVRRHGPRIGPEERQRIANAGDNGLNLEKEGDEGFWI